MIVITGATGALNGATARHLLDHVPASDLAIVARDTAADAARGFAERGVDVRYGDYADPASLPGAFAGADQLLLVSSSDPAADAVALHRTAIGAAVSAGAGRILYTSHQGAHAQSPFSPARDHAATELILAASGMPWTSLRNGFYLHSLPMLLGPWRDSGVIAIPADGPVSWTSRADSAEAAAALILSDSPVDGPVTITASSAPTFEHIAAMVSEASGRPIRLELDEPDAWVRAQVERGTPEFLARFTLGIYEAAAGGFFSGTDVALASLIGREPQSVREYLVEQ